MGCACGGFCRVTRFARGFIRLGNGRKEVSVPELAKHRGDCHCGRVRYEVETDLQPVMSCNCSICQKRGALLTFVPAARFTLRSGDDNLTDYQFNKKIVHHLFCSHCGVGSFARGTGPDGSAMIAVNVRCLDDVDPAALSPMAFDGKSL
jgi:hypothetical protein